jgi:hypothetical protein
LTSRYSRAPSVALANIVFAPSLRLTAANEITLTVQGKVDDGVSVYHKLLDGSFQVVDVTFDDNRSFAGK